MRNSSKRLLSFLLALAMIMSMVCVSALQVFAEEEEVASYNDVTYGSLQEALDLAQDAFKQTGARQIVTLVGNLVAEDVVVPDGVILDCNSKEVTVTNLMVIGSVVNTGEGGKLCVSGVCSISDESSAMPVYNAEADGYILYSYATKSLGVRANGCSATFGYSPKFNDYAAYSDIINGGKVDVSFRLDWDGCEEPLVFQCSDELMAEYAQLAVTYMNAPIDVAMLLSVTGLEALGSGTDLYVTPVLTNELGAEVSGKPMHYRVPGVKLNVEQAENGTVVADKNYYEIGDTITVTVTPNAGYNLIDLAVSSGEQSVDIGSVQLAGGQYSFVAQADVYTVEAEFAEAVFNATKGDWDLNDQYNGSITINEQVNGSTVYTTADNYREVSVIVSDLAPTFGEDGKGNFEMQVFFVFEDGMKYQVRLHNTDADGRYKLQNMGGTNAVTGWKWLADLTEEQTEKLLGEGVAFGVKLVDSTIALYIDDALMATFDLGAKYDGKSAQIGLSMAGNIGQKNIEIPYTLKGVSPAFSATKGDWDLSNQHNSVITINKQGSGSTVYTDASNYKEVTVTVSDLAPTFGEDGKGNFEMQVFFVFDNGKKYQVRLHNTDADGKYKLQNMGGTNAINGWKWLVDLTEAQTEKLLSADGVAFSVKQVGSSIDLWVDGIFMATTNLGEDYNGKTAKIGLSMAGNTDLENIEIPFKLKAAEEAAQVQLTIAETENGTVASAHEQYQVGDTVVLTAAPSEGYVLANLAVKKDGAIVKLVKNAADQYIFVAEDGVYTVEALFAEPIFSVNKGEWDLSNQHNGSITIKEQANGSAVTTIENGYDEVAVTISDLAPTYGEDGKGNFSFQISYIFDNGMKYQVRLHNTDADGKYKLQNVGGTNAITGWKWQADLTAAQTAKLLSNDGVEFAVKLAGGNAELWVDGSLMTTVALGDDYIGKTAQIKLAMDGNVGQKNVVIPFELKVPEPAPTVQLNIAEMTNGTVAPAQDQYQVGDTITLTIAADAGYSQKLQINGKPVLLDLNAKTYSFVATEEVYDITGSFEADLFTVTKGSWNLDNQQNGVLTITTQANGTAVTTVGGDYKAVSVTVSDLAPSYNAEGKGNFSVEVYFIFDNGKQYQVRLHNMDKDSQTGKYKLQHMGNTNSMTGWKWQADLKAAQIEKLLSADGATFTVELDGNNAVLKVEGTTLKTYDLAQHGYDGTLAQVKLVFNGNVGLQNIEIPYELG